MANPKIIKTTWRGAGSGVPLARAMSAVGKTFEGARMESGAVLQKRSGRLIFPDSATAARASSFGFRGFKAVGEGTERKHYMRLRGGYVKYLGRASTKIEDTADGPPITHVEIAGGTVDEPIRVCLQYAVATGAVEFIALAAEPVDSGTYWYRVLHTAYLTNSGGVAYGMDRRSDWLMGSPIA